jgi:hypothetical protein
MGKDMGPIKEKTFTGASRLSKRKSTCQVTVNPISGTALP